MLGFKMLRLLVVLVAIASTSQLLSSCTMPNSAGDNKGYGGTGGTGGHGGGHGGGVGGGSGR